MTREDLIRSIETIEEFVPLCEGLEPGEAESLVVILKATQASIHAVSLPKMAEAIQAYIRDEHARLTALFDRAN